MKRSGLLSRGAEVSDCFAVVKPGLEDSYSPLMAVTVGALLAVILLLAVAIFLMVRRRNKGCASPLAAKGALPGSDSSCGTAERSQGIDTALLVDTGYQEPYQALSYYSYSAIKPTGILYTLYSISYYKLTPPRSLDVTTNV